jgi:hypothetical protein
VRNLRQALASPHPGYLATRSRPTFFTGADMIRALRLVLTLVLAFSLAGCALALRSPRIAELKNNPARYHDKTVAVEGIVTSSWGVPMLPYRIYRVDDGSGELMVISQGSRVPTKGARVRVRGRVNEVATFGGHAFGLHLQERDLQVKRR